MALGRRPTARSQAVIHEAVAETSRFEDYSEEVVNWSGLLYRCDNVTARLQGGAARPVHARATCARPAPPRACSRSNARWTSSPSALGIDPLELRLKNYAEADQNEGKPFSSKELRACYAQGAERFGWAQREPAAALDARRARR